MRTLRLLVIVLTLTASAMTNVFAADEPDHAHQSVKRAKTWAPFFPAAAKAISWAADKVPVTIFTPSFQWIPKLGIPLSGLVASQCAQDVILRDGKSQKLSGENFEASDWIFHCAVVIVPALATMMPELSSPLLSSTARCLLGGVLQIAGQVGKAYCIPGSPSYVACSTTGFLGKAVSESTYLAMFMESMRS